MHPRVFLDTYWRNDLNDEVFVAMSFHSQYNQRWEGIFRPAIESERFGALSLKAIRVDITKSGDSILTEINNGIAHAQLIIADISVVARRRVAGEIHCVRNGNVMYEVGLALASRQPVEVLLVRDDDERLLFDLSHIPVIQFDPSDTCSSMLLLRRAIADRLRERNLLKDLRVARVVESLSRFEINIIRENAHSEVLGWKGNSLPAAVAMGLPHLLEKRILRLAKFADGENPELYVWTTFGRVISQHFR